MKKIIKLVLIMMLVLVPIKSMATETGHSKTVQITAKPGYQVTDVIVNGESKGPLTSYTFSDVLSPQSLEVITEAIGYKVTFDANGGEGTMEDQVFSTISGKLNKNIFTKEGYAFCGWSTRADGDIIEYRDQQKIIMLKDITLYALWAKCGDASGDGIINLADVLRIAQYINGGQSEINKLNADMNGDGVIDVYDRELVSAYIAYLKSNTEIMSELYTGKVVVLEKDSETYLDTIFREIGQGVELPDTYADEEGKVFLGWSIRQGGDLEYKVGETITITDNITLYGVWGLYGDLNDDEYVNASDSLIIQNIELRQEVINYETLKKGDVNLDGKLDYFDSIIITNYSSGNISSLPNTDYYSIVYGNTIMAQGVLGTTYTLDDYCIVNREDRDVYYYVDNFGKVYYPGQEITLDMNYRLTPIFIQEASSDSEIPMCKVYLDTSDMSITYNGTKLTQGLHEVPYGSVLSMSVTYGWITSWIKYNGKSMVETSTEGETVSATIVVCDDLMICGTNTQRIEIYSSGSSRFANNSNGVPIYVHGNINTSYLTWTSNEASTGQVKYCTDGMVDINYTRVSSSSYLIIEFNGSEIRYDGMVVYQPSISIPAGRGLSIIMSTNGTMQYIKIFSM